MTADDAKHLKAGTPVQFKDHGGNWVRGEVVDDATAWRVTIKWDYSIQTHHPKDMNDIHRAKRSHDIYHGET